MVCNTSLRTTPHPQRKANGNLSGKKRPHPVQGDEDEELLAELKGPPMKRVATAEAVVAALNEGL